MSRFQSRLVLGGSSLGKLRIPELEQLLHKAFELGISEIDSSPTYGDLERNLGQVLAGDSNWTLNTKIGNRSHLDFPLEGVNRQILNSLSLLNSNCVGTIFVHSIPINKFTDDILNSLNALKLQGLAKHIGYSSNFDITDLVAAFNFQIFDKFQVTCNIIDQSNLPIINDMSNLNIYFKRILGSGVLKTGFLDDLKLQTKIFLNLSDRFNTNDYHFRLAKTFGFFVNRKLLIEKFLRFILSIEGNHRFIVGVSDPNHLVEMVNFENQLEGFPAEEFIFFQQRFVELSSLYGWSPYR